MRKPVPKPRPEGARTRKDASDPGRKPSGKKGDSAGQKAGKRPAKKGAKGTLSAKERADKQRVEILEGNINRTILVLSWPVIVSMFFNVAYNLVDTFYVGKLGPDALAAVTIGFSFLFMIFAIGGGISLGITSGVARLLGAGEDDEAGRLAAHGIILSLVASGIMIAVGFGTLEGMIANLGNSENVRMLAWDYVSILIVGIVFMFMVFSLNGILRAEGNMMFPMYAIIVGTVINIVLDPIMIFGQYGFPEMGVAGAALATTIAQAIVMVIVITYIMSGKTGFKIRFRGLKVRFAPIKQILKVGFPVSMLQGLIAVGIFMFTIIAAMLSDKTVAALGLGFRLNTLSLMPVFGINAAVITMVGQNVGAAKFSRVVDTVKAGCYMAFVYIFIVALVFNLKPSLFIEIFTTDSTVISEGVSYIQIVSFSYIALAAMIVISGAFQGSGHAYPPTLIMAIRLIIVGFPAAWLFTFTFDMGSTGIWIGLMLGNVIAALVSYIWFLRGSWKKGHEIVDDLASS